MCRQCSLNQYIVHPFVGIINTTWGNANFMGNIGVVFVLLFLVKNGFCKDVCMRVCMNVCVRVCVYV